MMDLLWEKGPRHDTIPQTESVPIQQSVRNPLPKPDIDFCQKLASKEKRRTGGSREAITGQSPASHRSCILPGQAGIT
jgi:hypothetical protein